MKLISDARESSNKPKFDRLAAIEMLESKETFGFVLMAIAVDKYGEDMADDPEVLMMDLEDDFKVKIPNEGRNRIQAAFTAMTSDACLRFPFVFKATALALTDGDIGRLPDGDDEELDACRCLWATTEIGLLTGLTFDQIVDHSADAVIDMVNNVVDNEAEDVEEELDGDDVDTAIEAMAETYYQRFVVANMLELSAQLLKLGADPSVVTEILSKYRRSIADIEARAQTED